MRTEQPAIDLPAWVDAAPDARQRELRQAVHSVLVAVAGFRAAQLEVVMKGGILLAVGYQGDRYTRDVDFSTTRTVADVPAAQFVTALDRGLVLACEQLEYGLDCRVQSSEVRPAGEKTWPTLMIKVGYAPRADGRRHGRLTQRQAIETISVDISYNEVVTGSEVLDIGAGAELQASTLADLVAEKFRAIIQQPIRNRVRRQDAYDLYCLLELRAADVEAQRPVVLAALRRKAEGRGLTIGRDSLRNPEVERRSREEYPQLANEIQRELPEFENVYGAVRGYYESMPWHAA